MEAGTRPHQDGRAAAGSTRARVHVRACAPSRPRPVASGRNSPRDGPQTTSELERQTSRFGSKLKEIKNRETKIELHKEGDYIYAHETLNHPMIEEMVGGHLYVARRR